MIKNRVIVVDIDDTLYLERDYVRSGLEAVGAWAELRFGLSGISNSAWTLFRQGVRGTTLTDAFRQRGLTLNREQLAEAVAVYREHDPAIDLCPDARDFLDAAQGLAHVAIVSDGPVASQQAKVAALGLDALADPIILTESRGPKWHKPSVLAFREIEEHYEASSIECIYVGDNPLKDFTGPRSLNWSTARIRRPSGLYSHLEAEPGLIDISVQSFNEVLRQTRRPKTVTGNRA